jgi:hypothetical protein
LRERQETLVAKCVDTALIATTSPSTAPTDDQDVPPISDQGLLSPGDEASFAAVTAAWGNAHAQQIAKEAFIEIAEWRCNAREIVRVRLTKYCGRDVVDLRVWGLAGNGEYRPGPNGITLDIKQLPKLAKAVKKANRQAEVAAMIDAS